MFGGFKTSLTALAFAGVLTSSVPADAGIGYYYSAPSSYSAPSVYFAPSYGVGYGGYPAYSGYSVYTPAYYGLGHPAYGDSGFGFRPSVYSGGFGIYRGGRSPYSGGFGLSFSRFR